MGRDQRRARALAFLRRCRTATALEIGTAAITGEPRSGRIPPEARESIGLKIAVALACRGVVQATRDNNFRLV